MWILLIAPPTVTVLQQYRNNKVVGGIASVLSVLVTAAAWYQLQERPDQQQRRWTMFRDATEALLRKLEYSEDFDEVALLSERFQAIERRFHEGDGPFAIEPERFSLK